MVGVLKTGLDWTPTHGQYWTHGLKFGQSMATFAVIQDEKETNKLVVAYSGSAGRYNKRLINWNGGDGA